MRNKYTKEFENDMIALAPFYTLDELLKFSKKQYETITKKQLMLYLSKRQIRYKDYNSAKVREMGNMIPTGTERMKTDGMVQVKIAKDKWEYKQRLLHKKYHNCDLTEDDFIIFLNQNRNDFSEENLKKVTRKECSYLNNQQMFSKNRNLTNLGIIIAKLMIKAKEKSDGLIRRVRKKD